jgi:hypothetical protein
MPKNKKGKYKTKKKEQPRIDGVTKEPSIFKRFFVILLYFAAVLTFILLPLNKNWFEQRIFPYLEAIPKQYKSLDLNARKKERHGAVYSIFNYVCSAVPKGSYFLLPPQTYYLKSFYSKNQPDQIRELFQYQGTPNIFNFHCMDLIPVTLGMDEEKIMKAQYTFLFTKERQIQIVELRDQVTWDFIRREFDIPLNRITNRQEAYEFLLTQ